MGTKKGQRRKTARRAYEPRKVRSWRWKDSGGQWWTANQPSNWAVDMINKGFQVIPFKRWK